jgi:hypothetical protein
VGTTLLELRFPIAIGRNCVVGTSLFLLRNWKIEDFIPKAKKHRKVY